MKGDDGIFLFIGALFAISIALFIIKKWKAGGLVLAFCVLLILAIAIPGYIPASPETRYIRCLVNLKSIDVAKQRWAADGKGDTNAVPTLADLFGERDHHIGMLVCPSGGTYSVGKIGQPAQCSKTEAEHISSSRK